MLKKTFLDSNSLTFINVSGVICWCVSQVIMLIVDSLQLPQCRKDYYKKKKK